MRRTFIDILSRPILLLLRLIIRLRGNNPVFPMVERARTAEISQRRIFQICPATHEIPYLERYEAREYA